MKSTMSESSRLIQEPINYSGSWNDASSSNSARDMNYPTRSNSAQPQQFQPPQPVLYQTLPPQDECWSCRICPSFREPVDALHETKKNRTQIQVLYALAIYLFILSILATTLYFLFASYNGYYDYYNGRLYYADIDYPDIDYGTMAYTILQNTPLRTPTLCDSYSSTSYGCTSGSYSYFSIDNPSSSYDAVLYPSSYGYTYLGYSSRYIRYGYIANLYSTSTLQAGLDSRESSTTSSSSENDNTNNDSTKSDTSDLLTRVQSLSRLDKIAGAITTSTTVETLRRRVNTNDSLEFDEDKPNISSALPDIAHGFADDLAAVFPSIVQIAEGVVDGKVVSDYKYVSTSKLLLLTLATAKALAAENKEMHVKQEEMLVKQDETTRQLAETTRRLDDMTQQLDEIKQLLAKMK